MVSRFDSILMGGSSIASDAVHGVRPGFRLFRLVRLHPTLRAIPPTAPDRSINQRSVRRCRRGPPVWKKRISDFVGLTGLSGTTDCADRGIGGNRAFTQLICER